jgi:phosphoglycolate phosphatase
MGAILIDVDGTLVDSREPILESFNWAFEQMGLPTPPSEEVVKLIGHPLDQMFRSLGVKGEKEVKELVSLYKTHYLTIHLDKTRLIPGVREGVELAYQIAPLGIVTTKTRKYTEILLERLGLLSYFKVVIGREDVANLKPHPEPVLKAIDRLGVDPEKSFFIGDTCLDMWSGAGAGVTPVGVTTGYGVGELSRCAPYLFPTLPKAIEWIYRRREYR